MLSFRLCIVQSFGEEWYNFVFILSFQTAYTHTTATAVEAFPAEKKFTFSGD